MLRCHFALIDFILETLQPPVSTMAVMMFFPEAASPDQIKQVGVAQDSIPLPHIRPTDW
jgi:hypothetical protein